MKALLLFVGLWFVLEAFAHILGVHWLLFLVAAAWAGSKLPR